MTNKAAANRIPSATATKKTIPQHLHPYSPFIHPAPPAPKPTTFDRAALAKLYPPPSPLSIAHLTTTDIALYTAILSQRPPMSTRHSSPSYTSYRRRTAALIASLPPHLRNPTTPPLCALPQSYLVSLLHAAGATPALPTPSKLCRLHSGLNAQIVADALGALEMEAEDFLPALLATIPAHRRHADMSPALRIAVRAVQDFCATFLAPREFAYWFGRAPGRTWSARVPRSEEGCGACVLARVGSEPELLVGMRAAVLARMPGVVLRGEAPSPRLEWLAGWMRMWGNRGTEMLFRSGRLAEELRWLSGDGGSGDLVEEDRSREESFQGCGAGAEDGDGFSYAEMDSLGVSGEWTQEMAAARSKTPLSLLEPAMASSTLLRLSQAPSLNRDSSSTVASAMVPEPAAKSLGGQSGTNSSQYSSSPRLPCLDLPLQEQYPPPRTPPTRPLPPVPAYVGTGQSYSSREGMGVGTCG